MLPFQVSSWTNHYAPLFSHTDYLYIVKIFDAVNSTHILNHISICMCLSIRSITQDGTAEPASRHQILKARMGTEKYVLFPVQLTSTRSVNHPCLRKTLPNVMIMKNPVVFHLDFIRRKNEIGWHEAGGVICFRETLHLLRPAWCNVIQNVSRNNVFVAAGMVQCYCKSLGEVARYKLALRNKTVNLDGGTPCTRANTHTTLPSCPYILERLPCTRPEPAKCILQHPEIVGRGEVVISINSLGAHIER